MLHQILKEVKIMLKAIWHLKASIFDQDVSGTVLNM